jgi:hypothetical protein
VTPLLRQDLPAPDSVLDNFESHILIGGASGYGKSFLLMQLCLARLRDPRFGLHLIDPDGEVADFLLQSVANPANAISWRTLHFLQPASNSETFGLALLHVADRNPQSCHEAALRTRTIFEQVLNFGSGDYGPRLSKLFQLGCYGLALAGRPLVDLPDLFTLGAARVRELIGESYPYEFMSQEWRSLDVLGERNPTRFLEYCESITSRLMPTFGNPRMRRIFGQTQGIDFAHVLAAREALILDLSGLESKDAILLGTSYISLLFHEALKRPPGTAPHAFVAIDEVFDYMTPDLARAFDRLRKRNIQLCVAIQRLGQLEGSDDDKVAISNAILTNTAIKILFGGLDPDDAEKFARILFTGNLNLAEWKPGSERPVAVGQDKTTIANWSRAEMSSESEARASARSRAHGAGHGIVSATSTSRGSGRCARAQPTIVSTLEEVRRYYGTHESPQIPESCGRRGRRKSLQCCKLAGLQVPSGRCSAPTSPSPRLRSSTGTVWLTGRVLNCSTHSF